MSLDNMKTKTKISVLIVIAVLSAIGVGIIGGYFLEDNLKEAEYQKANYIRPIIYMTKVESNAWQLQARLLELADSKDASSDAYLAKKIDETFANCAAQIELYKKAESSGPAEDAISQRMLKVREVFIGKVKRGVEMAQSGDPLVSGKVNAFIESEVAPAFDEYEKTIQELIAVMTKASTDMDREKEEQADRVLITMIVIVILSAIILFVVGFYIARNITSVLNDVKEVALLMSENNLTKHIDRRALAREDEFGDMSRALDKMQENLIAIVSNIANVAQNMAASSQELTATSDQTANASNDVATSTTVIMAATQQAGEEVEKALEFAGDTESALNEMANSANTVAATAIDTAKTSHEGRDSVDDAVISINAVGDGTSRVTESVTELKDSSARIGEIVEMITGIASQTNLLALNAAIEAARAGDHGRGFAVVAEEVRKLAEESGNAAEQIGELIRKNTISIDHTVNLMEEQRDLVSQGVEKVNVSGQAFAKIEQMVEDLTRQIQHISTGVEQSAEGAGKIVVANKAVATAASKVIDEVTTVSAAAEQQAASTEEIASSSQVLAQMAEDLNVIATQFKI